MPDMFDLIDAVKKAEEFGFQIPDDQLANAVRKLAGKISHNKPVEKPEASTQQQWFDPKPTETKRTQLPPKVDQSISAAVNEAYREAIILLEYILEKEIKFHEEFTRLYLEKKLRWTKDSDTPGNSLRGARSFITRWLKTKENAGILKCSRYIYSEKVYLKQNKLTLADNAGTVVV